MSLLPPCMRAQGLVPAGFVDAAAVVEGLVVEMCYFGDNNFVGQRIDGYERPRCLLITQAANALAAIQRGSRRTAWGSRCSTATGRCARSPISCAGRNGSTT